LSGRVPPNTVSLIASLLLAVLLAPSFAFAVGDGDGLGPEATSCEREYSESGETRMDGREGGDSPPRTIADALLAESSFGVVDVVGHHWVASRRSFAAIKGQHTHTRARAPPL